MRLNGWVPSSHILHVDGDGFFASCEVAKDPTLRGRPVVVGRERGIALAMTKEAKECGVRRGMTIREVSMLCPDAIILPGDHETYALFSERMNRILGRYIDDIERYSVDESFAVIPGNLSSSELYALGDEIRRRLKEELAMTFSIGIARTKALAKIASDHKKPYGLTVIDEKNRLSFLAEVPIEEVWGIGRRLAPKMRALDIKTAKDLSLIPRERAMTFLHAPERALQEELAGISVLPFHRDQPTEQSLLRTRTFSPSGDASFLLSELSRHAEVLTSRARANGARARRMSFFLKKRDMTYRARDVRLLSPTATPEEIIEAVTRILPEMLEKDEMYRATGMTLSALTADPVNLDLFHGGTLREKRESIHRTADTINRRFRLPIIHLASSAHMTSTRSEAVEGETPLPFLGHVL